MKRWESGEGDGSRSVPKSEMTRKKTTIGRLSFQVQSVDCIACTPVFKREIAKLEGVRLVRPLVMLNRITVEFDETLLPRDALAEKILEIGSRAGYRGKIIFFP